MSTEGSFTGAAGGAIHWRAWDTDSPVAQVVIVHGYGEHGDRYTRLAERLNAEGISVWANDHRGHGRSEGHRGVVTVDEAVVDVVEGTTAFVELTTALPAPTPGS